MNKDTRTPGQVAYEGYCLFSDGKSLISGAPLPTWDQQGDAIREAWEAAAQHLIAWWIGD